MTPPITCIKNAQAGGLTVYRACRGAASEGASQQQNHSGNWNHTCERQGTMAQLPLPLEPLPSPLLAGRPRALLSAPGAVPVLCLIQDVSAHQTGPDLSFSRRQAWRESPGSLLAAGVDPAPEPWGAAPGAPLGPRAGGDAPRSRGPSVSPGGHSLAAPSEGTLETFPVMELCLGKPMIGLAAKCSPRRRGRFAGKRKNDCKYELTSALSSERRKVGSRVRSFKTHSLHLLNSFHPCGQEGP